MPGLSSKTGRKASRRSRRLMDKQHSQKSPHRHSQKSPHRHSQKSPHRHSPNSPRGLRLLFISELLEMIFLNLDMQTLLLSRRVCHTWDAVIQGSRKLQQALFYIPDTTIPAEQGRHNPLIIDKLWFNFPGAPMGMRDRMYVAVYGTYRDALFLPRKRGRSDEAYRRPEASWRRMLLRQPPTSGIFFWDPEAFYRSHAYISEEVDAHANWTPPGGDYIRMGNVAHWVDSGAFVPGSPPFVFWANPAVAAAAAGKKTAPLFEPQRELEILRAHLSNKYELAVVTESNRDAEYWVPGEEYSLRIMPSGFRKWFRTGEVTDVTLVTGESD